MIILDADTKSIDVNLDGAVTTNELQWVCSYIDMTTTTYTPVNTHGVTAGAAHVEVVAAPAASHQRIVKYLSVYNADTVAAVVSIHLDDTAGGGTVSNFFIGTLNPGEEAVYTDGRGFDVQGVDGSRKLVLPPTAPENYKVIDQAQEQRTFFSDLPDIGTFQTVDGTGYWVYMGLTLRPITPKYVFGYVSTVGAGAQTAEVGLFSTPLAPNKTAQTLTKLVSTGTVDDLTGTGLKGNTDAFTTIIPAGSHLWAGIRTSMGAAEPIFRGLGYDFSEGLVLSLAAAGALTGAGPWNGAKIAVATTAVCPVLRVVLD